MTKKKNSYSTELFHSKCHNRGQLTWVCFFSLLMIQLLPQRNFAKHFTNFCVCVCLTFRNLEKKPAILYGLVINHLGFFFFFSLNKKKLKKCKFLAVLIKIFERYFFLSLCRSIEREWRKTKSGQTILSNKSQCLPPQNNKYIIVV